MKSSEVCPKAGRAKWNEAYTLVRGAESYWMEEIFRTGSFGEMYGMKLPEAWELYLRILMAQAKASVTIEWARQPGLGWFSEMTELLLRGIPEVPECREWGTKDRNEETEGIGTKGH